MKRVFLAAVVSICLLLESTNIAQVIIQGVQQFGTAANPAQVFAADGTSGAPAYTFASETTLGFWRSAAATVTLQGALTTTGNILGNRLQAAANQTIQWAASTSMAAVNNGWFRLQDSTGTFGIQIKTDALPTVSSCGAGSPAVVAGSTPFSGAVTIGTTSVATCLITFNGTAYPNNAHCSGNVETSTAASTRAMGYVANTATLTIVPSAAWVDSSVVNWICVSPK